MTPEISSSDWSRFRTYLAYVAICVTVLLGAIGLRWYLHEASAKVFARMHKDEEAAAEAGADQLTMKEVDGRHVLKNVYWATAILIGACLLAVTMGLAQALYRMFLSPSVPNGEVRVCLPGRMLAVLVWQMVALLIAGALVQVWFKW